MASIKFRNPETGAWEKFGIPSVVSGMKMELLWENPDPNVDFAAQTILSGINYDLFLIMCTGNVSVFLTKTKPESANTAYIIKGQEYVYNISRDFTYNFNNQTLSCNDAKVRYTNGNAQSTESVGNTYVVPYQIYGIKLDSKSTSSGVSLDDYVTKDEIANLGGGLEMELLWENASPTSQFGAQNISLNNTDGVCFVLCQAMKFPSNNSFSKVIETTVFPYENGVYNINTLRDVMGYRAVEVVKESSLLKVTSAYYRDRADTKNELQDDSTIIPYRFYGIKGVIK